MSSAISYKHRLLFIHIPRTGGSSISYTYDDIFELPGPEVHTHRRIADFAISARDHFVFTVVRNPWAMCASWYQWHVHHGDLGKSMDVAVANVETPLSFGADRMNEIIRFESLREELDLVMVGHGIRPRKLLRLNGSTLKDYRAYYSDSQAEQVSQRFRWTIQRFGYVF